MTVTEGPVPSVIVIEPLRVRSRTSHVGNEPEVVRRADQRYTAKQSSPCFHLTQCVYFPLVSESGQVRSIVDRFRSEKLSFYELLLHPLDYNPPNPA